MATRRPARRKRDVLHVFDRDGRWWAHVPGRGRGRERVSLGVATADITQAEAYRLAAQRFAAGALDPRAVQAGRVESLKELGDKYIAENRGRWSPRMVDNVTNRLARFVATMELLGVRSVRDVTDAALARYVDDEKERPRHDRDGAHAIAAATINRTIQVVRRMGRWAEGRKPPLVDKGFALASWRNLTETTRDPDPVIPSPDEWAAVIRALTVQPCPRKTPRAVERWAANTRGAALLVAVAVQSGLRIDELRHLRAVDVTDASVAVKAYGAWRPKDHEERTVPVPPAVAALAREFVAWRERAVGLSGKPVALTQCWIEDRLPWAWAQTGLPGDPPGMHDCRRTFATEMARRAGVGVRDVQALLGHADLETTQRYLGRYRSDEARRAIDMGVAAVLTNAPANVIPLRGRSGA